MVYIIVVWKTLCRTKICTVQQQAKKEKKKLDLTKMFIVQVWSDP